MSNNLKDADMSQVLRLLIDENTMSVKVLPELQGDIQIELSADDGDSVQVRPMCGEVINLEANQALDVSAARSLFISSTSSITTIQVSLDSQTWHELPASGSHLSLDSVPFKHIKVQSVGQIKALIKG